MTTIVKRIAKGSTLTVAELDANVTNLNNTKLETTGGTLTGLPVLANQDVDIISPVYPTTKPSLNLDFTRGQLDPRITFVRNNTATYYDGQTSALAEQNLVLQSQFVSSWPALNSTLTANSVVAPDGATTAATLIPTAVSGAHGVVQSAGVIGNQYTYSVYGKSNGYTNLQLYADSSGNFNATFDLTAGTAASTGGATVSIVSIGSGWYRCIATFTQASSTRLNIQGFPTGATASNFGNTFTGDGTSGVFLWGAQLEQRSSATAYTPTTTSAITNYIPVMKFAPAGVARFDCDPITGKSLGLLIEESRTNLLTYSTDFNTSTNWLLIRASKIANSIVAPDGTQTGIKLIGNTTPNVSHWISDYSPHAVTAGSSYTFSVYAKAGEYNYATLYPNVSHASTMGYPVFFDLTTGAVSQSNYTPSGYTNILSSSVNVGNGWWRISITAYALCSNVDVHPAIGVVSVGTGGTDGTDLTTQNGYSGIYVWGPQFEANGSSLAIRNSTIGTGSTTTAIVLDAGASVVDGTYVGNRITYSGLQEIRTITAYVGATKTATISVAASVAPILGASYTIVPALMTSSGFATSYIPTPTVAVTRAADQASMTGTNFSSWYNQAQGTFSYTANVNCFDNSGSANGNFIVGLGLSTNNDTFSSFSHWQFRRLFARPTLNEIGQLYTSKLLVGAVSYNTSTLLLSATMGGILLDNNIALVSVGSALNYDRLGIGNIGRAVTNTPAGSVHIKKISYYPIALSSSNLVALTS